MYKCTTSAQNLHCRTTIWQVHKICIVEQLFGKCTKSTLSNNYLTSAQNLHCRTTIWQVHKIYIAEQLFDKCTKSALSNNYLPSAQNLHCRTTIFAERLPMTASAFKHDHHIIIIKYAGSLKIFWYEEVAGRLIEIKIC